MHQLREFSDLPIQVFTLIKPEGMVDLRRYWQHVD